MKKNKKIQEWDLSIFFKSDNDPEIEIHRKEIEVKNYSFINKWNPKEEGENYRQDYLKDPRILKEALDEFEQLVTYYTNGGDEGYYFWLRSSLDHNSSELKSKLNKVIEFEQKIENEIQFFTIRISRIDKNLQATFLSSFYLKNYKHFLEKLFLESKYLLSEKEEKILNLKSKSAHYNWIKMTEGFLTGEIQEFEIKDGSKDKYVTVKKSFAEIMSIMSNSDKRSRDNASKAFNNILNRWVGVAENELNSILEDKKVNDKLRNVKRPDELRHLSDDIDSKIVDTLVSTVKDYYYIGERFYKLKANLLNLTKLEYHERNLSYELVDKSYSFKEAEEFVGKTFKNLDIEFYKIFKRYLKEGRVDVYPRQGKTTGAFMMSGMKSQPNFILLNFTEKLNDLLTLAHEMGHGIHYELARKQNSLNYGTTLSTTEVASTFMEDFVLQEIMKNSNDELKLSLLMMKLNEEVSTIIRQIAIYSFELDLHKQFDILGYLSKEKIGELFKNNMNSYMGEYVEQSEGAENWWIYITHIRNFFYVYSYSSGLLISKSLQNSVKNDPTFIKKVKEFFAAGLSLSPKDIFMKLGVNIEDKSFWVNGLNELNSTLVEAEQLAKKLGKII